MSRAVPKPLPSVEALRARLAYDPANGALTWVSIGGATSRVVIGTEAGCLGPSGHRVIKLGGVLYYAHRIIWKMVTGDDPPDEVDHVNLIRDDNRWVNLRLATRAENGRNLPQSRRSRSPYKGVTFHKRDRRWQAKIIVSGVAHHLGYHATAEQAHEAYVCAARKYHGSFARVA